MNNPLGESVVRSPAMPQPIPEPPSSPPTIRWAASLAVSALFLVPAVVLILDRVNVGPQYVDQALFHWPTVQQIAEQWPNFDVRVYRSATTPGYHFLIAAIIRAGVSDLAILQLCSAMLTAGFLATLAWIVSARQRLLDTILLCLPAAWSPYIFSSGLYLVPHNPAWWGVLLVMLVALRPRADRFTFLLGGVALLALVLVRQIHLWALAPLLVAAWLGSAGRVASDTTLHRRIVRVLWMLLAALPAIGALAWFFWQWGGAAPKTQEWVRPVAGINFAAIAMMLAIFGLIGVLFLPWIPRRRWSAYPWRGAILGCIVAAAIAAIPLSAYDVDAGRWSGFWNVVARFPVVLGRSPLLIAVAALGGFVIASWLSVLDARSRWIAAIGIVGFIAAHATINQAWQRYYEPFVLLMMLLLVATAQTTGDRLAPSSVRRAILLAAAILQAALTILTLRG